jgi:hypothetical protein
VGNKLLEFVSKACEVHKLKYTLCEDNLLHRNINIIQGNREVLLDASKKADPEVNADKTK